MNHLFFAVRPEVEAKLTVLRSSRLFTSVTFIASSVLFLLSGAVFPSLDQLPLKPASVQAFILGRVIADDERDVGDYLVDAGGGVALVTIQGGAPLTPGFLVLVRGDVPLGGRRPPLLIMRKFLKFGDL